jgi:hypothetical protein
MSKTLTELITIARSLPYYQNELSTDLDYIYYGIYRNLYDDKMVEALKRAIKLFSPLSFIAKTMLKMYISKFGMTDATC